ncbi:uncharacterized protein LY89DRAFT_683208 [Mollisia scopiformis]|uniref:Uncharacterized protein n=1 Tax=Mollisia scopiformis TaxID=149040 RepID=A0A194XGS2_MOLSC|nr:uncharacterized protein LY89DRAFT_683208 [Mollisia scopiformis]KUJ19329.1 hypothetical protein LY89DRAFT_683208 [Mollisia scopiformis]
MAPFSWANGYEFHAIWVTVVGALGYATFLLVKARLSFYEKVKQGLPMPKWNPVFGHLLTLNDLFESIPIDSGLIFPFAGSVLVSGREQLLL